MTWTTTDSAQQFLQSAGLFLRADAASNTVLLTAAESVAAGGPAVYGDEPPRRAGVATIADRALVSEWIEAFARETGAQTGGTRTLDGRLAAGSLTIWRDGRGTPVALAGWSREVAGMRRIGPVYTLEQHRRRGYGAAVTAVACRRALQRGTSQLLLYADIDNPTSTTLYQRLGFAPVENRVALRFKPRP